MENYWKEYWTSHVQNANSSDAFTKVMRVQNKQPQSTESFQSMIAHIRQSLSVENNHTLLDLCCGNGLITEFLIEDVKETTAVDFSEQLISDAESRLKGSVTCIQGDAKNISFPDQSFDRVLVAAALQHFTETEIICLLRKIFAWLKPSGKLLITDILDVEKRWDFYNSREREMAYFEHLQEGKPILGTWISRDWLEKLALYAGYSTSETIEQPPELIYSHYRFDFACFKSAVD